MAVVDSLAIIGKQLADTPDLLVRMTDAVRCLRESKAPPAKLEEIRAWGGFLKGIAESGDTIHGAARECLQAIHQVLSENGQEA